MNCTDAIYVVIICAQWDHGMMERVLGLDSNDEKWDFNALLCWLKMRQRTRGSRPCGGWGGGLTTAPSKSRGRTQGDRTGMDGLARGHSDCEGQEEPLEDANKGEERPEADRAGMEGLAGRAQEVAAGADVRVEGGAGKHECGMHWRRPDLVRGWYLVTTPFWVENPPLYPHPKKSSIPPCQGWKHCLFFSKQFSPWPSQAACFGSSQSSDPILAW